MSEFIQDASFGAGIGIREIECSILECTHVAKTLLWILRFPISVLMFCIVISEQVL